MKISIIPLALGQLGQRIVEIMTAGERILPLDRYDVDTTLPKQWVPFNKVVVHSERQAAPKKIEKSPVLSI